MGGGWWVESKLLEAIPVKGGIQVSGGAFNTALHYFHFGLFSWSVVSSQLLSIQVSGGALVHPSIFIGNCSVVQLPVVLALECKAVHCNKEEPQEASKGAFSLALVCSMCYFNVELRRRCNPMNVGIFCECGMALLSLQ